MTTALHGHMLPYTARAYFAKREAASAALRRR